jgi:integrase
VKNIESDHDVEHADPFTREEIERIGSTDACPVTRMITFNCWAGLSLSEMAALAREDVDLPAGILRVRRAYVVGEYKVPKERARIRTIELIDPALQILKEIMRDAEDAEIETVLVTQRDNVSVKKESLRFLFKTPSERAAWTGRNISKWFTAHLEKAGVRHRGVNQCRHTFASQALSSYVPVEWVARQLGHSDTTMVRKHYGRWIPSDTKSMAGMVSQMMGFRS